MLIFKIKCQSVMAKLCLEKKLGWPERHMALAMLVAMNTSCLKRGVGAVVVKYKRVLGTGYNGAAPGVESCVELGECLRISDKIESGRDKDYCQAVHAEENAILNAGGRINCFEADLYCTAHPCTHCSKLIVASGIKRIFYFGEYDREEFSLSDYTLRRGKVEAVQLPDKSLERICAVYEELIRHIKARNFRFLDKKE